MIALEPGTAKTVLVDVTAENGDVARTILWLSRERVGPGRDTNTRLARLQLAGAQLTPAFDPRVLDYEAKLAANVASVTLTAAAESPVATIEVDGQPLARTGRVIALEPGTEKTVIIDVTAESGSRRAHHPLAQPRTHRAGKGHERAPGEPAADRGAARRRASIRGCWTTRRGSPPTSIRSS